jgi:hypothetical protein
VTYYCVMRGRAIHFNLIHFREQFVQEAVDIGAQDHVICKAIIFQR